MTLHKKQENESWKYAERKAKRKAYDIRWVCY